MKKPFFPPPWRKDAESNQKERERVNGKQGGQVGAGGPLPHSPGRPRAPWEGRRRTTLTPEKIKDSVASERKLQENEHNLLELKSSHSYNQLGCQSSEAFLQFHFLCSNRTGYLEKLLHGR